MAVATAPSITGCSPYCCTMDDQVGNCAWCCCNVSIDTPAARNISHTTRRCCWSPSLVAPPLGAAAAAEAAATSSVALFRILDTLGRNKALGSGRWCRMRAEDDGHEGQRTKTATKTAAAYVSTKQGKHRVIVVAPHRDVDTAERPVTLRCTILWIC
jgi:hypothetical protein